MIAVGLCCGCRQILGFEEAITLIDAPADNPPATFGPIAHVGVADQMAFAGTGELVISSPFTIDTTQSDPLDPPDLGAGVRIVHALQSDNPDIIGITILEVGRLEVRSDLRVIGSTPLIIIAADEVVVTGTIDVSGTGLQAGAGSLDIAPGGGGVNDGTTSSGGGGGGYASVGGNGGESSNAVGGSGGPAFGNKLIAVLGGGSFGGGDNAACSAPGAPGGALQISAPTIVLDGVIDASGGGGSAGTCALTGGAGGGSGGAIYLQANLLSGTGLLVVAGGGGAGGSDSSAAGAAGGEASAANDYEAPGGAPGGSGAGAGGPGASISVNGSDGDGGSIAGGGGGGAAGRIFLDVPFGGGDSLDCRPACARR